MSPRKNWLNEPEDINLAPFPHTTPVLGRRAF